MLVDSGRILANGRFNGHAAQEILTFCLYTNAVTWTHATVLSSITEAAWTGYLRAQVGLSNWHTAAPDGSFNAVAPATASISFTNGSGGTVTANGFFVVGQSTGVLYGGAAFSPALSILAGQIVSTIPYILCNAVPASP